MDPIYTIVCCQLDVNLLAQRPMCEDAFNYFPSQLLSKCHNILSAVKALLEVLLLVFQGLLYICILVCNIGM